MLTTDRRGYTSFDLVPSRETAFKDCLVHLYKVYQTGENISLPIRDKVSSPKAGRELQRQRETNSASKKKTARSKIAPVIMPNALPSSR